MQSFYHHFSASQTSTLMSLLFLLIFEYIIFDACPLAMKLDLLFALQQIVLSGVIIMLNNTSCPQNSSTSVRIAAGSSDNAASTARNDITGTDRSESG